MSQVFVSYASTDSAAAQRIERALKAAGMSVDSPKTTSPPEIKSAQCILIVWSRAAAESESLQEEVRRAVWAWSSGRLLIAVLDDAPLPIGLRDVTPIRIGEESGSRLEPTGFARQGHCRSFAGAGGGRENAARAGPRHGSTLFGAPPSSRRAFARGTT